MIERRTAPPGRHAAFRLDGSGGTVAAARSRTSAFLEECIPPLSRDAAADVLVVVSELVTNAVKHAPGPCCVYLVEDGAELTVAVSDESVVVPVARDPDMAGRGGFGWHLVVRLAKRVNVYVRPPWGKTVSATMRLVSLIASMVV